MPESENVGTSPEAQTAVLSQRQAEVILTAEERNFASYCAQKVAGGKTLTKGEKERLREITGAGESDPNYADNQVQLAKLLGVNRKTIQRAKKRPGAPEPLSNGKLDVKAWRTFFSKEWSDIDDDESEDLLSQSQLRARQILLQNQKLEFQLALLRKEYVPVADVEKWGGELGALIRSTVAQIHLAAPSVVGLSVPEAESRLKEVEDEILEQLHTLGERMEQARRNEPAA